MRITWIGHSCFRIDDGDHSAVIDPYSDGSVPGLSPVREEADCVLCTHDHADHSFRDGVRITGRASSFSFDTIDSFHDDAGGKLRGMNRIIIVGSDDCRIAHLGDLGSRPDDIGRLRDLDALLIPAGGFFTIDGKEAAALAKELRPRIIIPMHYRDDQLGFGYDVISTIDDFTSEFGNIIYYDGSTIDISDRSLSGVVVLKPKNLLH